MRKQYSNPRRIYEKS